MKETILLCFYQIKQKRKYLPVLDLTGGPTFHDECRWLFCTENRFHFFMHNIVDQIVSNVSTALRNGSEKNVLSEVTPDMLTNSFTAKNTEL